MTIKAVVFDFDGLILDTETSIWTAWCAAFEAHGCEPPTIEEWSAEVGTVGALDIVAMFRARAGAHVDVDAMHSRRRAHREELLAQEVLRPGVDNWLAEAENRGLGIAIASSSEYEWVDRHLCRLGLRDRFGHVACHGPELAPKPAPDTYLDACAALQVAPKDALAVEDSPHGVSAARAAGLRVVAVPNPVTARMDLTHADLVLASLADRPLGQVLPLLAP
jgi:HAD superfamily hydrolase (TIGR01509 family)